ncbi:FKBP-type peptidyl-prolyl cis-trans isomerase [Chlamydiota bacterium]
MKRVALVFILISVFIVSNGFSKGKKEVSKIVLKKPEQKISYAFGMDVGNSMKKLGVKMDMAAFIRGVEDSYKGNKIIMSAEEAKKVKEEFFTKKKEEQKIEMEKKSGKNLKEGKKFLKKNKKKKGVVTTDSGLQYIVLKEGTGLNPDKADRVKVHYRGTLLDGTEFDSSYKRGTPAEFALSGVIPGWSEGVALMKEGSKYRFFIPPNLAYGERGAGRLIQPNSTLIFDVELLGIETKKESVNK